MSDPDSSYAYIYDDLDRVTSIDNDGTAETPHVVLSMEYDANGNRGTLSSSVDSTADLANAYLYDALNRLTRISQSGPGVASKRVDWTYDDNGRSSSITRYGDLDGTNEAATTSYTFDDAGRLTHLAHTHGPATISDFAWIYNAKGQLTSFTGPDGSTDYAYDATGQLTGADSDYRSDESYSYDQSGNRTMTGYVTDANNRLTSDGAYSYEYDGEGNRTRKTTIATGETVEYGWDHRNRLVAITFKDDLGATTKTVEYTYDVLNRRIAKTVDGTTTERYLFDGQNILFVFDSAGNLKARYLQGPGMDNTLAEEDGSGSTTWLLPDHQGSIRDVIDNDGTVLDHLTYDSFGNILTQTSTTDEPRYTYTGREWDGDAEMFYYRARWYDAKAGRFISEDPIGFAGGDANLTRYVGNDPGNGTDPLGMQAIAAPAAPVAPFAGNTYVNQWAQSYNTTAQSNYQGYSIPNPTGPDEPFIYPLGIMIPNPNYIPLPTPATPITPSSLPSLPPGYQWDIDNGPWITTPGAATPSPSARVRVNDAELATLLTRLEALAGRGGQKGPPNLQTSSCPSNGCDDLLDMVVGQYKLLKAGIVSGQSIAALLEAGAQRHHLNQAAMAKGIIPYMSGLSVMLDPRTHAILHASLREKFWGQFQKGGERFGDTPTYGEYAKAMERAMKDAGCSEEAVQLLSKIAAVERRLYGMKDANKLTNVPSR